MKTLTLDEINEVNGAALPAIVEYAGVMGAIFAGANAIMHGFTSDAVLKGLGVGLAVGAAIGVVRTV